MGMSTARHEVSTGRTTLVTIFAATKEEALEERAAVLANIRAAGAVAQVAKNAKGFAVAEFGHTVWGATYGTFRRDGFKCWVRVAA